MCPALFSDDLAATMMKHLGYGKLYKTCFCTVVVCMRVCEHVRVCVLTIFISSFFLINYHACCNKLHAVFSDGRKLVMQSSLNMNSIKLFQLKPILH